MFRPFLAAADALDPAVASYRLELKVDEVSATFHTGSDPDEYQRLHAKGGRSRQANLRAVCAARGRITFQPAALKRDGAFHGIEGMGSARVDRVVIRSGYHAPAR